MNELQIRTRRLIVNGKLSGMVGWMDTSSLDILKTPGNQFVVAWSIVHENDEPDRGIGRRIVVGRICRAVEEELGANRRKNADRRPVLFVSKAQLDELHEWLSDTDIRNQIETLSCWMYEVCPDKARSNRALSR